MLRKLGGTALVSLLLAMVASVALVDPIGDAITAALGDLIDNVTLYITSIAPVALGVAAIVVGWKYAVRLVKRI